MSQEQEKMSQDQLPDIYITEFFENLAHAVHRWIGTVSGLAEIDGADLSAALESYINYSYYPLRDRYCSLRCAGFGPEDILKASLRLPPRPAGGAENECFHALGTNVSRWAAILSPLRGQPVYYANNRRMIEYMMPFLLLEDREAVLVTECALSPSDLELPPHITAVRFVELGDRICGNRFMEKHFPVFFSFANTIKALDSIIQPPEFYCVCGCHSQSKLWALMCNRRGGRSICYQHGWPAFMHAGFTSLPFQTMRVWGGGFKRLWSEGNPGMKLETAFYPYPIEGNGPHDSVAFFLQEPYFVSSGTCYKRFVDLVVAASKLFPDTRILYRVHPESSLDSETKKRFAALPNLHDVSARRLESVYASTRVVVSHFSSAIMECIVHGCTPLVFNPTPGWDFKPDLEMEKIGFVSHNETEFFAKLEKALKFLISPDKQFEWFSTEAPGL